MADQISQLEEQLAQVDDARARIDAMNELALKLRFSDLERSIHLSRQAYSLSEDYEAGEHPYQAGKARSLHNLAIFETQQGNYEKALETLFKALMIYELLDDHQGIAEILSACGRVYIYTSDYPNALDYHLRALAIAREINAPEVEAISLNNLGYLYLQINQYEKAKDYLRQSLELAERLENIQEQADALANCCMVYFNLNDHQTALDYGHRSLELYRSVGSRQGEAAVLNSLGVIYRVLGEMEQALHKFQMSIQISEEIGSRLEVCRAKRSIGDLYLRQGDSSLATDYLKQALAIALEINSKREQAKCHLALAEIYKQLGDTGLALIHHEQYSSVEASIFGDDTTQRLKTLESIHRSGPARKEVEAYLLRNVALQQEIIERRQTEQALKNSNEQLRQEIFERERLIADLNAFSHMVAHDLKNPLSAIAGYSSLLSALLRDTNDIRVLRYLEIINQTSMRMSRIIDELLLLASVREKTVVAEPLDMAIITDEVVNRLEHTIIQNQAQINRPATWPTVMGHAAWIEEVWVNYITNAMKYGGVPPLIELGADTPIDGRVRFWVRDNGAGISLEDQEKLFTAFTRLDDARAEGYGLGLSIVKRIIEKLGGAVSVESSGISGEGCTFGFTLPVAESTEWDTD